MTENQAADWLREADFLRNELHRRGSRQDPEEILRLWEAQLEPLGESWLELLDESLLDFETACQEGRTFHLEGQLYFRVIERCSALLEEPGPWLPLIEASLVCLRNSRSLALADEAEGQG